jgi:hypothetical protein
MNETSNQMKQKLSTRISIKKPLTVPSWNFVKARESVMSKSRQKYSSAIQNPMTFLRQKTAL